MFATLPCCVLLFGFPALAAAAEFAALKPAAFAHHIERFNSMEDENVTNFISNAQAWNWLQKNIPLFECPDRDVEEIYYYRWWSFRKHIKQTPKGFVITEFLTPVSHAGEFNTISCAAGFHLADGRWLHDDRYLNDYTQFWLRGDNGNPQPHFHKFSSWFAAAVWDRYQVNHDGKFITRLLNLLVADYRAWETERQLPNGLFWQYDVRDGMEESISGSRTAKNIRPTINSYMFANAQAIANIARLANQPRLAGEFATKAEGLKRLLQEYLWDADARFFKVRLATGAPISKSARTGVEPRRAELEFGAPFSDAREALGFIPWMFGLPGAHQGYEAAWSQFTDPQGFRAPFGLTTAERRHPEFRSHGIGTCEWDGAVWPFASSQTLYALANLLRDYLLKPSERAVSSLSPTGGEGRGEGATGSFPINSRDYFSAFLTYVHSQHAGGKPYIGEYLDETTGDWINGKNGRSRYYNHSTYADLLITGVIGLRPRADNTVEVFPQLPGGAWDWFCLDGVKYHGRILTILWDKEGSRYRRGAGLVVLVNGREIGRASEITPLKCRLP